MSDKIRVEGEVESPVAAKPSWVRPTIEIAEARQADAFLGPTGGVDYGTYS